MKYNKPLWYVFFILGLFLFSFAAYSHDPEHPELNGWYMSLHSKNGIPCCDISDAHAVAADDWKTEGDHFMVMVGGNWQAVPVEAVVDGPNKAGKALVWFGFHSTRILCFMPGPMT